MAYSVANMIANLRADSGENSTNPTAVKIVELFNRVTRGPQSCLLPLFPALGSDDFGVNVITKDITADGNTHEHSVSLDKPLVKLGLIGLLFSGDDEYVWLQGSQIYRRPISENDELAYYADCDNPVVGYYNGKIYSYPEPVGIRMIYLADSDAVAVGGASFSFSDRLVDIGTARTIAAHYRSLKIYDAAKYWDDRADAMTAGLIRNAPGRIGPTPVLPGPGNLRG